MNIIDTTKVELFRLGHDPAAIFWGFAFIPSTYLLFTFTLDLAPVTGARDIVASVDPMLRAAGALAMGGNPVLHLFVAIGATTVYGAEYQHATWRLIGPRARRSAFFLAKTIAFVLLASTSLTLMAAVSAGFGWMAILIGRMLSRHHGLGFAALPPAFVVSILELTVIGLFCALFVVLTRSRLAAVIATLCFSIGQALAESYFFPPADGGWWLLSPVFAGDFIRTSLLPTTDMPAPSLYAVGMAGVSLVMWCGLLGIAAVSLLKGQDWSRE